MKRILVSVWIVCMMLASGFSGNQVHAVGWKKGYKYKSQTNWIPFEQLNLPKDRTTVWTCYLRMGFPFKGSLGTGLIDIKNTGKKEIVYQFFKLGGQGSWERVFEGRIPPKKMGTLSNINLGDNYKLLLRQTDGPPSSATATIYVGDDKKKRVQKIREQERKQGKLFAPLDLTD